MAGVTGTFSLHLPGFRSCRHPLFPALELLKNAIGKAGYTDKVVIGMDVAASEFFRSGKYDLDFKSPDDPSRYITPDELANLYKSFIRDYPGECSGRPLLRPLPAALCRLVAGLPGKCVGHLRPHLPGGGPHGGAGAAGESGGGSRMPAGH